jgi:hypothetical protein
MSKLKALLYICPFILSASALADMNVKIKGGMEFQSAYIDNNGLFSQNNVSANKKHFGLNSSGHVNLEVENETDLLEYGGKINLETTQRNDRRVASLLYLLSDYGKLEFGSDKSAMTKMKITGYSVAAATAGGWDMWVTLPKNRDYTSYITNFSNFLDAKTRETTKAEYSRKISYFTPKIYGLQFGVSYIPDTSNAAFQGHNTEQLYHLDKPNKHTFAIRDGISYGASYEYQFAEKGDLFKIAVVGEQGKVKATLNDAPAKEKFSDLKTYTIGSEINYKNFGVSISYTDYLKSITSKTLDVLGRDTKIYGASGRYRLDKLTISITYIYSSHKKNNMYATTLAFDYKLASGLLPYAEATYYLTNGKYLDSNQIINKEKVKGLLVLAGLKVEF